MHVPLYHEHGYVMAGVTSHQLPTTLWVLRCSSRNRQADTLFVEKRLGLGKMSAYRVLYRVEAASSDDLRTWP